GAEPFGALGRHEHGPARRLRRHRPLIKSAQLARDRLRWKQRGLDWGTHAEFRAYALECQRWLVCRDPQNSVLVRLPRRRDTAWKRQHVAPPPRNVIAPPPQPALAAQHGPHFAA